MTMPLTASSSAARSEPLLAPRPLTDKYPLVIGAGATLAYASNVLRLCTTGYRREGVDFARELLERDGATKMLLASRFATVAGGRIEVVPPELPPGDKQEERAKEIAEAARFDLLAIPSLRQELFNLLWGCYYGVAVSEIGWKRGPTRLTFERLYTIANRRIAYPDAGSWDPHIWDQGAVLGSGNGRSATNGPSFGLNIAGVPNKFIVHTPSFAADYPTREGMMRELVALMIMKIMGLRSGAAFVERFTKIVFYATYSTSDNGDPRTASNDDIDSAFGALQQLGLGSLAAAAIPDSIKFHMEGPATKADNGAKIVDSWVTLIDSQIASIVRGSTFTTMPGRNVGKGVAESGDKAEAQIEKFDAECLAETMTRDLLGAWTRINYPGEEHLCPRVRLHINDPSPQAILQLAIDGASCGIPVDADATAAAVGLRVTPNEDKTPRRMAPISPVAIPASLLGADVARLEAQLAEQEAEAEAAAEAQAAATERLAPANDNPKSAPEGEDEEPQLQAAE